ncbi:SDR family NAD(P)-dependent oxidoreductase [Sphingomonas psychrotolerans]|uniref:NADP-dependent 3-hydroxy acid dehydrogenase YdfG n=1 Tax=Sphingomonas psychrotolerans TaxID=1327635 RepID=A0ABU3N7N7_9SPHN|nr:SDR family NAD(P)-dependent oxidoreductase [Sphingomonas psychrotolerans]MDT8759797.1 SDR family NAD(P)-dependent oxidoreductase [Sphingomonas psychrotolerans]
MPQLPGTALITGASSGIGAVYADRLAKRGYDLVLAARDMGRMETLAERLRNETGVGIEIIMTDLTRDADVAALEARLGAGDITLLINNAGKSLNGSVLENGPAEIEAITALNVTAPARLAAAAAKIFAAKGSGAIVNIASVLALAPEMFDGIYSGTKAFLLNLSQAMSAQLSAKGVYTQAVLPGATRTEIWARSGKDVDAFPPDFVMDVEDLVDAALLGFDRREPVTIPPLPDEGQWTGLQQARLALGPNLSKRAVAPRYVAARTEAA